MCSYTCPPRWIWHQSLNTHPIGKRGENWSVSLTLGWPISVNNICQCIGGLVGNENVCPNPRYRTFTVISFLVDPDGAISGLKPSQNQNLSSRRSRMKPFRSHSPLFNWQRGGEIYSVIRVGAKWASWVMRLALLGPFSFGTWQWKPNQWLEDPWCIFNRCQAKWDETRPASQYWCNSLRSPHS